MSTTVSITGAHSTGKSALVRELELALRASGAQHICVVSGVARSVLRMGLPLNRESTLETYLALFEAQLRQEVAAHGDYVLLDRFLPDYVAYARAHGNCPETLLRLARHCYDLLKGWRGYDHVFLLPIEIPFAPDGHRDPDPEYQLSIDEALRGVLSEWHQAYCVLHGSLAERLATVLERIQSQRR